MKTEYALAIYFAITVIVFFCVLGYAIFDTWNDNNCKNNPLYPTAQGYKSCVGNNQALKIFLMAIFFIGILVSVFGLDFFKTDKDEKPTNPHGTLPKGFGNDSTRNNET